MPARPGGPIAQGLPTIGRPNRPGWYVVRLSNGDVGMVYGDQHSGWHWGAIRPPAPIVETLFFTSHISSGMQTGPHVISGETQQQQNVITHALDSGNLGTKGQPVLVTPGGQLVKGSSKVANTSDVQSAGIGLPSIGDPLAAIVGFITSTENWLRIGEAILGALLLILGLRALTGGSGDPVQLINQIKRKVL